MSEAGVDIENNPPKEVELVAKPAEVPNAPEVKKPSMDAILIFGQGPVIEKESRRKAGEVAREPGSEDINLWSQTLARAAAELYKRGVTREIIIMGGRTGGKEYASEADLIAKALRETYHIPENAIKLEATSTNTLENLVNVLNIYFNENGRYKDIGVLGTNYHLARIRLLMDLFNIQYKTAFSAEEVVRFAAREGEKWDNNALLEIEHRLDTVEAGKIPTEYAPGYFPQQEETEKKDVLRRVLEEDVWSRALLEIPEYWLGYLGRLKNGEQLRRILASQDQGMLKEKFGIDVSLDNDATIKEKLLKVQRKMPDLEEWIRERDWPTESQSKLEELAEARNKTNYSG